ENDCGHRPALPPARVCEYHLKIVKSCLSRAKDYSRHAPRHGVKMLGQRFQRRELKLITMSAPAPVAPKKKVARKPKKPAAHPPVAKMVAAAIAALKDRKGSSLQAIKKYIAANYKNMLAKGLLTQAKGKGAAGSFRLGAAAKKAPKKRKAKKPKAKKAKKAKKARKPKAKKAKKPKAKKAKKAKKPAAKKARKACKKTKRVAKK
ncbi:histone H3-K27 trimethylation, partial [Branchiostoma belcheri]